MFCLSLRLGILSKPLFTYTVKREIQQKKSTFAGHIRFYLLKKHISISTENSERRSNITSMAQQQYHVFHGISDRYQGVTVDSKSESCDAAVFAERLNDSLTQWIANSVRAVWFKITLEHADWVPILAKNDFVFHRVQGDYVVMYRWLPTTQEPNIPSFAHTMIGVGAIVVNSCEEVLVVKERFFVRGFPFWKLPGGYIESGEDIDEAARREVLEETGIETKFNFVVSFRQTHGVNFDCSDMYFIVNLSPLTEEIKKCDREIVDCQWMKVSEYMEHPNVHEGNRFFVQKYLECRNSGKVIGFFKGTHPILKRPYTVYSIDDVKHEDSDDVSKSKM